MDENEDLEKQRAKIEFTRKLAELIKSLSTLEAELTSIGSVLKDAEESGRPPADWLERLNAIRGTEEYQKVREQYEPVIAKLEKTVDEYEMLQLLRSMPVTRLVQ